MILFIRSGKAQPWEQANAIGDLSELFGERPWGWPEFWGGSHYTEPFTEDHMFSAAIVGLQSQESRFYWKNLKYANWVWKITEERRERTTPWALLAHWIPPRAGLCFLTWLFRSFLNCNEQTSWRPLSVLPTTDSFCFSFRVSQFAEKLLGMTTVSHKEAASPTLLQVGIFMKAP